MGVAYAALFAIAWFLLNKFLQKTFHYSVPNSGWGMYLYDLPAYLAGMATLYLILEK